MDGHGRGRLPFRAGWTAVDGGGHGLEIYGSRDTGTSRRVRYLTLAEAVTVAKSVTDIERLTLIAVPAPTTER